MTTEQIFGCIIAWIVVMITCRHFKPRSPKKVWDETGKEWKEVMEEALRNKEKK